MAANTITRTRLRQLADVKPERGRVLSVFLNLDPTEFATPAARSTAVTSVMTEAARRVEQADGLEHEERVALKADIDRVRETLMASDIAQNGTRAVAVYACQPADLLEVVRLNHPVDFAVVLDRSPYIEPLVADGRRGAVVRAARQPPQRALLHRRRRRPRGDRPRRGRRAQPARPGRLVAVPLPARRREGEGRPPRPRRPRSPSSASRRAASTACSSARPTSCANDIEHKLHPYLRERIVGRLHLDVENSSIDDVRAAAGPGDRGLAPAPRARGAGPPGRGRRARRPRRRRARLGAAGAQRAARRDAAGRRRLPLRRRARPRHRHAHAGDHGPDGQELERVENIVEPAIEKAVEQSAKVIKVRHHDDLGPLGGIGAVLRY